ncbi:hypothetical protein BD410DRAFT_836993 [Rickenella mellea]|uniref:HTH APSES-type domain-containing protein n=1 Tax=Rickenella mellea TaxID=50990 RepID=A0A4Y7QD20_9AGAM|nr:hypothetical protein BD410DRAFT_836993 [Rickenella mellea]
MPATKPTQRPPLPLHCANPLIENIVPSKPPPVKYQVITREGQEIVVGRVKIQTPGGGHAFILRRFDTGSISLTTMFRAAFPTASDDAERAEAAWVKANYDSPTTGAAGSARLRLAGTWVAPEVAAALADRYALSHVIPQLANATPDPNMEYRKSTKAEAASPPKASTTLVTTQATQQQPTPSPTAALPNPSKRRKESSPAPSSQSVSSAVPPPRRTTSRTTSPAPRTTAARPTRTSARKVQEPLTPATSDQTLVDEEGDLAEVPGPDMHTDVAEQREMIAKLKAQRSVGKPASSKTMSTPSAVVMKAKRSHEETEDKPPKFEFKEPSEQEVGEREVRSNRRIYLQPQQKSAAWGAFFFAAGFAAMAALPNYLF